MLSNDESIFYISSQESSAIHSKKSNMASLISANLSEDKDNLFNFIKEFAINNDLPLPNKEKDFGVQNNDDNIFSKQNSEFELNSEKMNKDMLKNILLIISKHSH